MAGYYAIRRASVDPADGLMRRGATQMQRDDMGGEYISVLGMPPLERLLS